MAGDTRPCENGCGWSAYPGHATCCRRCEGADGAHAADCCQKNRRVRPECSKGCGRPAFDGYATCCSHCRGGRGPHAHDCEAKLRRQAAEAPAASHPAPAAPAGPYKPGVPVGSPYGSGPGMLLGGGGAGGAGGGGPACGLATAAPATLAPAMGLSTFNEWHGDFQARCGGCGLIFPVRSPAGAPAGAAMEARCPRCHAANQLRVPRAPAKPSGRQRALLIGINYFGTRAELRGCINDVVRMRKLLVETFRWDPSCIQTLRDDDRNAMPTRKNIEAALRRLVQGVAPGDSLFLHFSGHGAQKEDPHGFEEDGMNETILPCDFKTAGQMTDDEISKLCVQPLPECVRMTVIMDCCHSGTGIDLPWHFTQGRGWREETNPLHCACDVQMFSGCEDEGTSADAASAYGAAAGAMTTALCETLHRIPSPTYPELLEGLHRHLKGRGFKQRPQLTSTQCFDLNRTFLLTDILPNQNPVLGRIFRKKFSPHPRPMQGPLAELLGVGLGVAGVVLGAEAAGKLAMGVHLLHAALGK